MVYKVDLVTLLNPLAAYKVVKIEILLGIVKTCGIESVEL